MWWGALPAARLSAAVSDLSLSYVVCLGDNPSAPHCPPTDILELGITVVESSGAAKAVVLALFQARNYFPRTPGPVLYPPPTASPPPHNGGWQLSYHSKLETQPYVGIAFYG